MKFTLAVAQLDSSVGDIPRNIRHHVDAVRRAKEGGADLVVFPELSITGYSIKDSNWETAIRADQPALLQPLLDESRDIAIAVGCVEESPSYGIHNSAFYLEGGAIRSVHRKVYPPTYGMFEELRYFSPGKSVQAFDASVGRIGMLICEDLWHLPLPYLLAQDGAQMILGLAASPTRLAGDGKGSPNADVNSEQHRALARLLSTYVVFCNRVGFEDGVNFWGGSEVIDPHGNVVVRARLFEEDLVFAEVTGNELRRARRTSRHFLDDDIELVRRELRRISRSRGQ
jgi:predicted amidohydrolase